MTANTVLRCLMRSFWHASDGHASPLGRRLNASWLPLRPAGMAAAGLRQCTLASHYAVGQTACGALARMSSLAGGPCTTRVRRRDQKGLAEDRRGRPGRRGPCAGRAGCPCTDRPGRQLLAASLATRDALIVHVSGGGLWRGGGRGEIRPKVRRQAGRHGSRARGRGVAQRVPAGTAGHADSG